MVSKQTLGTIAASAGVVAMMVAGLLVLSVMPQNRQGTAPTTPAPISTEYSPADNNLLAPAPTDTPTDTPVSTDAPPVVADPTVVAPAPVPAPAQKVAAPAPAPAPAIVAPAPAPVIPPVRCPAGSSANSNDGTNDTSCYPDICLSPGMIIPDPAHPECDVAFKP